MGFVWGGEMPYKYFIPQPVAISLLSQLIPGLWLALRVANFQMLIIQQDIATKTNSNPTLN